MTVSEYKKYFIAKLHSIYDEQEILSLFYWTMEENGFSKSDCIIKQNDILSPKLENKLLEIVKELSIHKPLQYIIGKANFYGYDFVVSPDTLIPRSETEELVEWILETMKNEPDKKWKILDIGTGSGCIPIVLKKKFPKAEVYTIDVSKAAIEIAKKNALQLQVDIHFINQDILLTEKLAPFDLIVSNPPYVRELEKIEIKKNVLDYEPHLALFVSDKDPLIFYRKITQLAKNSLPKNGKLFFEINQYLGKETVEMVKEYFSEIELKKDLKGNERMMKIN